MKESTVDKIVIVLLVATVMGLIMFFIAAFKPQNRDPKTQQDDMIVSTDTLTGCQYLRKSGTALTPRLGQDGKPMCGKAGNER